VKALLERHPGVDLRGGHDITAAELTDKLGLTTMRGRQVFVHGCCSTTGDGLHDGLDWLAMALHDA
jgi:hypothetical protein